jgi:hypothetical protein
MDTNKHELGAVHWRPFVVKGQQTGAMSTSGLGRSGRLVQNMSSQKVNHEANFLIGDLKCKKL